MNFEFAKKILVELPETAWDFRALCEVAGGLDHKSLDELAPVEERIMGIFTKMASTLTFEQATDFAKSFPTKTGRHRVMITWANEKGFESSDQVRLFLAGIETEKFFGKEALDAIKAATTKAHLEIDVDAVHKEIQSSSDPMVRVIRISGSMVTDVEPECMCAKHQLQRMKLGEEETAKLLEQCQNLREYMTACEIGFGNDGGIQHAMQNLKMDDRAREIMLGEIEAQKHAVLSEILGDLIQSMEEPRRSRSLLDRIFGR